MTTEQTRDALAQLEAVLAEVEVDHGPADQYDRAKYLAYRYLRTHAETLRALLGAADGVLPQLPKARELTNYAGNVPLPYYTADDMLRFAKATYTATLTKAPAND